MAWPLAARAQQAGKLPTIGFLGVATPSAWSHWVAAFVQRLRELGWIEGRTVAIEYRWAEGRSERFAEIAAEFVRLKVDVIVTAGRRCRRGKAGDSSHSDRLRSGGGPGRQRPRREPGATRRQRHWPVDPVTRSRWQAARTFARGCPGSPPLAIMANVGYPAAVLEMGEVQAAARTLGLEVTIFEIRRAEDIAPAFEALKEPRRSTLCLCRSAHRHQSDSHQHLGAGRATADDSTVFERTSKPEV